MFLPNELIDLILEYENPYKNYYYKNIILYFKNKYIYNILMKQLKQYCVYNQDKKCIFFNKFAILNCT